MLFGKLLESVNEAEENDLYEMEQELRKGIDKVKGMASSCKITTEDDIQFQTNEAGELVYPDFKSNINYSEQFWKTYLKNEVSFSHIKEMSEKTSALQLEVEQLQSLQEKYSKLYKLKNRKKNRRLAVEIQKNFTCPYERCYKVYGSDVSLNLHIKLKHNGGNKTDREKLAEQICRAELKGEQVPEMRLNLPPGYLEEFRRNFVDKQEEGAKEKSHS